MIYLASASPRRCELLDQLGIAYEQLVSDISEIHQNGETPQAFVVRLALEKARAALSARREAWPLLGADTVVTLDDVIYGKPADVEDAARMLRTLSGRTHHVITGVAMTDGKRERVCSHMSRVCFAELDEATINAYIATGEPFGKAGAYAIQGRAAGFIKDLQGSYSGVMGLPLFETRQLLEQFGLSMFSVRQQKIKEKNK
jgi:septum formation protein